MADLALKLRGAQLLRPKNAPSVCTSCVSFVKTNHSAARTQERNVDWKEVQACLKHGEATLGRKNALRIEYNGVVVVTTPAKRVITAWRSAPKVEAKVLRRFGTRLYKLVRNAFNVWRLFPKFKWLHLRWLLGVLDSQLRKRHIRFHFDPTTDLKLLFRAWRLLVDIEHATRVHDIVCADGKQWAEDVVTKRTVFEAWVEGFGLRPRLFANGSVLHPKSFAARDARYRAHVMWETE